MKAWTARSSLLTSFAVCPIDGPARTRSELGTRLSLQVVIWSRLRNLGPRLIKARHGAVVSGGHTDAAIA